jgi:hypothetical protein
MRVENEGEIESPRVERLTRYDLEVGMMMSEISPGSRRLAVAK